MSGCIAAIMNPSSIVLEASIEQPKAHSAVLRFRTDSIGKATGIPFKKVNVRKSIWYKGQHHHRPDPAMANYYSRKVTGKLLSRSIWNLDPVDRFVAPSDFHTQLIDMVGKSRIQYGHNVQLIDQNIIMGKDETAPDDCNVFRYDRKGVSIVSTIPMPTMMDILGTQDWETENKFLMKPIFTARAKICDCDVNQTIYFPENNNPLYRATITGEDLILEFVYHPAFDESDEFKLDFVEGCVFNDICPALGISPSQDLSDFTLGSQRYGKIAPVDTATRKNFMFESTRQLGIYSLGRFATWRNILLDDVYDDVFAIRKMINQSPYDIKSGM